MRTITYSWKEALDMYGIEKEYNGVEQELHFLQKNKFLYGKLVVATSLVLTISSVVATGGWSSMMPLNLKVLLELMAILNEATRVSCIILGQLFVLIATVRGTLKDLGYAVLNITLTTVVVSVVLRTLELILLSF